jgi:hypothetical protein
MQLGELKSRERTILQLERQLNLQTGRVQEQRERLLERQHEAHPRDVSLPLSTVLKNAAISQCRHELDWKSLLQEALCVFYKISFSYFEVYLLQISKNFRFPPGYLLK